MYFEQGKKNNKEAILLLNSALIKSNFQKSETLICCDTKNKFMKDLFHNFMYQTIPRES